MPFLEVTRTTMSLNNKLVLAFLLVTIVPLSTIIGVLHYTFLRHAEEQVGTRLEDSVIQVGKSVDEFMFSCIRGMKDLAEDPELSSGDRDIIHKQLSRYIHSFPYYREVTLVDAHGLVIVSSSPLEEGASLFTRFDDTRAEFEQALHRSLGFVYISDLNEIPESLRRVTAPGQLSSVNLGFQMLTAVQDAAGHTVGILVGDIVSDPLGDLLVDLKRLAPGDGSAFLLDKEGLVLMTTDPQAALLSPHLDVTSGALRVPWGQNSSGYLVYRDAYGRQQMAGYSRLRTYGANQAGEWGLISLASYDAILAPVRQSFNWTLGFLFVTLVGAVGLGLWLARRLANPVLKLTESAKTIAAGRYDALVAVTTHDEIGALAEAFNLMARTLQTEITKRAQAQESLRGTNEKLEQRMEERTRQLWQANEQLHALSRSLFQVQEDERRHLARELHDHMGQALTAAKINVQAAQHLQERDAIVRRLDDSVAILEQLLQQARQLALELRPPLLDDLGLVSASRSYLYQQAQRAGLRVEFFADPALERADAGIETACFRVAQEALTNVVRHARAQTVIVELDRTPEVLHLVVRDDGIGFDVAMAQQRAQQGASLGLLGMRERVALLGGELDCNSAPGRGTEVHAFFPVQSRPDAQEPRP
jgi:signal transduction histidine kinase